MLIFYLIAMISMSYLSYIILILHRLKFMMSGPSGTEIFISSDMFFVEVMLEPSGLVRDVKIHHEGKSEPQVSKCDVITIIFSYFLNQSWRIRILLLFNAMI